MAKAGAAAGGAAARPRRPARRKACCKASRLPSAAKLSVVLAGLLLIALACSGNLGVLSQLAITMGHANTVLSAAATVTATAAASALNLSANVAVFGAGMVSGSTNIAATLWDGVDLANVSLRRKHGRIVFSDSDEAASFIFNHSSAQVPMEVQRELAKVVMRVSSALPLVEAGDVYVDTVMGSYCNWQGWGRRFDDKWTGFAFVAVTGQFSTQWANPAWAALEIPLLGEADQILLLLRNTVAKMEPLNQTAIDLSRPKSAGLVPRGGFSTPSQAFSLASAVVFMASLVLWCMDWDISTYPVLREAPIEPESEAEDPSPGSSHEDFALVATPKRRRSRADSPSPVVQRTCASS